MPLPALESSRPGRRQTWAAASGWRIGIIPRRRRLLARAQSVAAARADVRPFDVLVSIQGVRHGGAGSPQVVRRNDDSRAGCRVRGGIGRLACRREMQLFLLKMVVVQI